MEHFLGLAVSPATLMLCSIGFISPGTNHFAIRFLFWWMGASSFTRILYWNSDVKAWCFSEVLRIKERFYVGILSRRQMRKSTEAQSEMLVGKNFSVASSFLTKRINKPCKRKASVNNRKKKRHFILFTTVTLKCSVVPMLSVVIVQVEKHSLIFFSSSRHTLLLCPLGAGKGSF